MPTESSESTEVTLASRIDSTRLTFAADETQEAVIEALCREAMDHGFRAVCVRPKHVALAHSFLFESPIKVATVIGFPLTKRRLEEEQLHSTFGNFELAKKFREIEVADLEGAVEFDMVANTAQIRQDFSNGTTTEFKTWKKLIAQGVPGLTKLILETGLWTDQEIILLCHWALQAGIGCIKTSTGMLDGADGATSNTIRIIRSVIEAKPSEPAVLIKASGGIQTREKALELVDAGADIIGTSKGLALL